jgi:hypothetical protein
MRLLLGGILAAAVGVSAFTMGQARPSAGEGQVAFIFVSLEKQECRDHAICFSGTVKNIGVKRAEANCWVDGFSDDGTSRLSTPAVKLTLDAGDATLVHIAWDLPPQNNYTGNCDPGPIE